MLLNVDKELPTLPRDLITDRGSNPALLAPPSTGGRVNMARLQPMLDLDKSLSTEDLALLCNHWNEATSARCIRFQRQRVHNDHLHSAPLPTSEGEDIFSHANDCSMPICRKRWGIFTRKQTADAQKSEDHALKTSKHVCFLNTAKVARSMPNLNAAAKAGAQRASPPIHATLHEATASPPAIKQATNIYVGQLNEALQELVVLTFLSPIPDETPDSPIIPLSTPVIKWQSTNAPVNELDDVSQEPGIELDHGGIDMDHGDIYLDDGGIYLTFDPEWRSSCGEVILTFLLPIPNETSNSPLIPWSHSLSELHSWQIPPIPRITITRASMHTVDELQSFLGIEI
ncbi:hypothetical protein DFH29DRAFT_959082 [Suillus ampliporus]|nr:hypothetical protein DFH29DRAFT_959082 [Suillus ampliporus]